MSEFCSKGQNKEDTKIILELKKNKIISKK